MSVSSSGGPGRLTSDPGPVRVLVLCTGNRVRSQIAEAFLQHAGRGRLEVRSAGTHPSSPHWATIRVLAERGIDWSAARSKSLTEFLGESFDLVVTVCDDAYEACPVFPGAKRQIHRAFPDPRGIGTDDEILAEFRRLRDQIQAWAEALAAELLSGSSGTMPAGGDAAGG